MSETKKVVATSTDRDNKKHSVRFNFTGNQVIDSIYIKNEAMDQLDWPGTVKVTIEAFEPEQ